MKVVNCAQVCVDCMFSRETGDFNHDLSAVRNAEIVNAVPSGGWHLHTNPTPESAEDLEYTMMERADENGSLGFRHGTCEWCGVTQGGEYFVMVELGEEKSDA